MLLKSDCPQCRSPLRVAQWTTGQTIGCPACGAMFFPADDEVEASKRGVSVGTPKDKKASGTVGRLRPRAPRTKGIKLAFALSTLFASLLLVTGMAIAMVWFSRRVPDPDIMALVPSDAESVAGMNVEEGSRDDRAKKVQAAIFNQATNSAYAKLMKHFGVEQDRVMRVLLATGRKSGTTMIVKLRRGQRFDPEKFASLPDVEKTEYYGDRSYAKTFREAGERCFHLAAPRVLVASTEWGMQDLLGRPPGEISLGLNLRRVVNRSGGSQVWWSSALEDETGKRQNPFGAFGGLGGFGPSRESTDGLLGGSFWLSVSGEFLELSTAVLFEDRAVAGDVADKSRQALAKLREQLENDTRMLDNLVGGGDMARAIRDGVETATIKTVGPIMQASIKLDYAKVEYKLFELLGDGPRGFGPMAPPMPGGPAPKGRPGADPPGGVPPL